ncbi:DAK2 domain-containing protein [Brevibacillus marinus]|uniref:DAK2 domain-containing protein n=1 Tax=Brevibacillus marinus TaxID=2496837 RepID=UPI000F8279DC|nr:DAK2 domain-containing protein [Brevibacillus marinus]
MIHKLLGGDLFSQMVYQGASHLKHHVKTVDSLNVFPVPDGDTGTNMNLTISSGVDELARKPSAAIGEAAAAFARGLLMGARGNSGVILSQLFRGFHKAVSGKREINARQFAEALKAGVETAYQAVMKPVEGTILTVAREAAEMAVRAARATDDLGKVMEQTCRQAEEALKRTPELLPILKEVGVVDSGGQGLVFIYEGFLRALRGESAAPTVAKPASPGEPRELERMVAEQHRAQAHLKTEEIAYGYCTEFMIWLAHSTEAQKKPFVEAIFRSKLSKLGDSLLVVADDEVVKVHIHAENPGDVLNYAQQFGSLHRIKIDNMREQHAALLEQRAASHTAPEQAPPATEQAAPAAAASADAQATRPYGIVAVAAGKGIAGILESLGVHVVVQGGQTMNPSTEDLLNAIAQCAARQVIVLPNNSNIVMAAQQAASLAPVPVAVVPTKSIPQGMAALLAFNGGEDLQSNLQAMTEASQRVKTGLVTHAVRDTQMGAVQIKAGDYIGIAEGTIVTAEPDVMNSAARVLAELIDEETEIVTILYGEGASEEQAKLLKERLANDHPAIEVEVLSGGQPLYPFVFSVE